MKQFQNRLINHFLLSFLLVLSFLICPKKVYSQEEETEEDYTYKQEYLFGFRKSTDAGFLSGFTFKYGNNLTDQIFEIYGIELVNIKHPKEVRYFNPRTGGTFIWQKSYYLYSLRFQYGREEVLFKKGDFRGVQTSVQFATGPSLGILAPYYILYRQGRSFTYKSVHFNPNEHTNPSSIAGTGYPLQGIFQSKLRLGANMKASVTFEFGSARDDVVGVEVGFLVDAFLGKLPIMPVNENKNIYPSAFLTLFLGFRK
ncbi:hypothetical protein [Xanthovirga aplysinae]|uniref:hypothetical protein n=1 Tax=Xanthovirga aplysinae TaxID=2529853 RepID=UPI0012BD568F|nr:hypothetical protein [Xanthovirga aplysinae]MTI32507.1 hypothetical protein [Xanthovirga aplysinae]